VEVRPGYKQTDVGVIPDDWNVASLGELTLKVGSGITPTGGQRVYRDHGRPFVRSQNVGWGSLLLNDVAFIDESTHSTFPDTEIHLDDVLLNITGASIGRSALADSRLVGGNVNQHVCIIRSNPRELVPGFLNLFLLSARGQHQIDSFQAGGNRQGLNFGQVRSMRLPLPPTEAEQSAIAAAVSDVDALLDGLDRLIAKKRDLKQAAMQQLLTGQTRLPGFQGEWEVKRLGDVAHIKTGSRNNEDKVEDGEYPFFVRSEVVERINSYSHDCEAILVPGEGRIGEIFHYINGRFDVHQRVYAITQFKPGVSGRFVHRYMAMNFGPWAMQNTVKATVDSLRLPTFQAFELRVPPTSGEQTAIAAVLSDMDAEVAALEARRDKTFALKQGMMQDLLAGRIRLVASAVTDA
jgi:type I restriction enzyme S subunit